MIILHFKIKIKDMNVSVDSNLNLYNVWHFGDKRPYYCAVKLYEICA